MKKVEQANFPEFEQEMLKIWEAEQTFEQSLRLRQGAQRFSFYDGPPFANGLPHYGHVVAITEKDSITRYKTMRGYFVPRRNGWDTHGLPVEYEVEKQLGISGKKQILELGVDKFNEAARASVFKYQEQWEEFMTRIGRWADKNSYATLDDSYIESVWWVHGELFDKGLVYKGFRSNPYCPRCDTPLSNFEVNQNYKDNVSDPSVYVKFPVKGQTGVSLLAWTTTPWSLPANVALAVNKEAKYVTVEMLDDGDSWTKGEKLILAKNRVDVLELRKAEYKVVEEVVGEALMGMSYEPLYKIEVAEQDAAWKVYADESVSLEDGTGILHVAPRYGETDLAMGQRLGLPLIQSVDGNGQISKEMAKQPELKELEGMFFKEADDHIITVLTQRGRIFAAEKFEHTYPFCWRCESPLLYFAMPSWFVKVTSLRDRLVANNEQISWVPSHIKQGRFGNWLAEARDWNFSRNRFWGAPIPIWVNEADATDLIVVKSIAELKELTGEDKIDLHRPYIDELVIERDGKVYRRTEEVFDCWFESGSMPYAQDHYPFEGKDEFEGKFPAEFIAEGLDQTRGWFYTLHVLGTALFDKPAFKNVIVHGMVLAADGKKLSKRLRNYPEPAEIFNGTGADSLRFFLMSSPVENGEDVRFSYEAVNEVTRNVFMTLWNVVAFFTMYAEIDQWQPNTKLVRPQPSHVLDRWMLARLDETIAEMTKAADKFYISKAVEPLKGLIADLSNWYVRRSRRRFGKSIDEADKTQAYETLHYTLLLISQLLAPWSPFVSDKIWRVLTENMNVPKSVHLSDWPESETVDEELLKQMQQARIIVSDGLAQRAAAGVKVRQPLAAVTYSGQKLVEQLEVIAAEELNVKRMTFVEKSEGSTVLNTEITQELKLEGYVRDLIRQVQDARKKLSLNVDDRIDLLLGVTGELAEAANLYVDLIKQETLASALEVGAPNESVIPVRVAGQDVTIEIRKI